MRKGWVAAITAFVLTPLALADVTYVDTISTGMTFPGRLAVTPGGGLYVTEPPTGQVLEYDAAGELVATYPIDEVPVGIAVDATGDIYVSRADGVVGIYDASFALLGTLDPTPFTLVGPNDIAVHPDTGEIYVVDSDSHQIFVFDGGTAALARTWGTEGTALAELMSPQALALDPAMDRVIVADTDNFRIQVFDTAGVFQFRFGYRILYTSSGEIGWMPRSEGVAVDACSNIYITDAVMGTVRAFDAMGKEIDPDFLPVIGFGTAPGQLRVPCDLLIAGSDMYIADTNNAAVQVYDVTCSLFTVPSSMGKKAQPALDSGLSRRGGPRVDRSRTAREFVLPDNPFEVVAAIMAGDYVREFDLNRDRVVDDTDLQIVLDHFGAGTMEVFLSGGGLRSGTYDPPHVIDIPNKCGRCHAIDGAPGGMLTAWGQENLCLSCHSSGKIAQDTPIGGVETGANHPWGVPADSGDVMGPEPGSELSFHLDNGDIRCGTCHNPHENQDGSGFMRRPVGNAQLCGECHAQAEEWYIAGHADWTSQAFTYPIGESRRACVMCHSGLGFIDYAAGIPQSEQRVDMQVISCFVCHAAHGYDNPDLMRIYGEVVLPGDTLVTDAGVNATCMTCHNGRRPPGEASTPHYALAGVMLEGVNGNEFGATIMNSAHTEVAGCVQCHMAPGPESGPGAGKVGGHTFNLVVHDEQDPDFGFENVGACNTADCHGGTGALDQINRMAYGDYDGDGEIQGIQDEVASLMDIVFNEILATGAIYLGHHPYWDYSGVVDDPPGFLQLVKDVVWNWEYVKNSGSRGIHNTGYAVGLLQVSYEQLTGEPLDDAELRYVPAGFGPTIVEIQQVNGGDPVEVGAPFTVDFSIVDGEGDPIPVEELSRLQLYVSGPTFNYQRVIGADSNHFAQNPDGSYTYSLAAFPDAYLAPLNDSPAFDEDDGEMTGMPILEGTYTVLIESRRDFGSIRKAGDATFDFVVAEDPGFPPDLEPRQFVMRDVCNACHNDLQIHGSNRFAVTGCAICHTAGAEDWVTNPESTPGLTIKLGEMIHKIHAGHALQQVAATAHGADPYRYIIRGRNGSVIDFSDVGFPIIPSGITDCMSCHMGAAQADEIYTSPDSITQASCTACHDGLDFVTGTILDDSLPEVQDGLLTVDDLDDPAYRDDIGHTWPDGTCLGCHGTASPLGVEVAHTHPTSPDAEGTLPVFEIVSVTGATGGGGAYFVPGDFPAVQFRVTDIDGPVELVSGDRSAMDRIEVIFGGPTDLYQTVIPLQRPRNNGNLAVPPENWIDDFAVDGTYTFISVSPIPANFPPQLNTIGEPPADQIFPFEEGWGQLYTADGTPLSAGTYTVFIYGRRIAPVSGEREPAGSDQYDVALGADLPLVPYGGTLSSAACNECHGVLAFHGNAREGVITCLACHTAGTQDGGTFESVDLRIMVHKLHNARNLWVVEQGGAYELAGFSGVADFSHLLISSMPGGAAECHECHVNDAWKFPPVRENMRTWMVACTSCHDSPDTRDHVDMMTVPGTFEELCELCHGENMLFSVEDVHATP